MVSKLTFQLNTLFPTNIMCINLYIFQDINWVKEMFIVQFILDKLLYEISVWVEFRYQEDIPRYYIGCLAVVLYDANNYYLNNVMN